ELIDETALSTRTGTGILERIEGLAPGIQFDNRRGTSSINMRGINTFSLHLMNVLIIVDNFPYAGDIESINPNDVATVTLLKDAAATSIWGARAGNGVLVITTKKSQPNEQEKIEFSNHVDWADKYNLHYTPVMSPSDFIDVEMMLFESGHYNSAYN